MRKVVVFSLFSAPMQIAVLWLVVTVTGIMVAYVSHLCREKYAELASMENESNQLQIDFGRYLLEQSAWGSLQRIEMSAADELGMHNPLPSEIVIIRNP
ncbi:MAG: cell division protein FtsL [Porticoccaceae bacterium]|nr:cell division protein FtsL [Porticoccaceae bacterium]